jgi:cytochrome c-type biogenesis protein CcmH
MLLLYSLIALLLCVFLAVLLVPIMMQSGRVLIENPRADTWIFAAVLIFIPVAAILLYLKWGASKALEESYAISRTAAAISSSADKGQLDQVTQKFLNYLNLHPHDAKGWYLLGRLYLDQGNIVKAAASFKHSFENDPKNSDIMAQYAEALYLLHDQKLTEESLQLVQKVLSQDAKNVTALNLLAMDAFLHHRYQLAMTYWQKLRGQYPENSPEFKTLTQAIEICKGK